MEKKIFLSLFLAVAATTGIIQTADDPLIVQSNDDKDITLDGKLWRQSGTLRNMWENFGFKNKAPDQRIVPIEKYTYANLVKVRPLLTFASKFPIVPLPENPTFNDLKEYDQQVKRAAQEFSKKIRYPDISKHPELFALANFFDIPVVMQAIAYNRLTPESDPQKLKEEIDLQELVEGVEGEEFELQSINPLQFQIADQLKKRSTMQAKANYFATGNTQDPYFKGVSIQDLIDHNRIPQITNNKLDLSKRHISSLDGIENIPGLQNLTWLDLDNNQITTFPGKIEGLDKLRFLELNNNQITTFPDKIEGLSQLEYLQLKNNQITTFSGKIEGLQNLKDLDLSKNQLTTFPGKIEGLPHLEDLKLKRNQITTIPSNIQGLPNLQTLSLRSNPIQPKNVGGITISADNQIDQLEENINASRPVANQIHIPLFD